MVAFLGGVARWRLGARCVARDSRRRVTLSSVVVASMAERPGKVVQQYITEDGLMAGGCGGLIPGRRPG